MSARHLACIVGWPVSHSLSPAIHNAAFRALGLDWTYVPLAVRPGAAEEGVGLLRTLGVAGANVTMPHKQAVIPFLDACAPEAEALHTVNTIVREGERLVGHTTDGEGFVRALAADAGLDPEGRQVVLLGAGGAARAVAVALAVRGARVRVCARRPQQAAEVAGLAERIDVGSWDEPGEADLVVNATPLRQDLPVGRLSLGPGVVVVDMIYAPPRTPLVQAATEAGAEAHDGLGMLVHQAALSFELWTGQAAPIDVMAAAARAELAARAD